MTYGINWDNLCIKQALEATMKASDWTFERSSGYEGMRNQHTGEWLYMDDYNRKLSMSNFDGIFFTVIGKDATERRVNLTKIDDDFRTIALTEVTPKNFQSQVSCDHIELDRQQLIELGMLFIAAALDEKRFEFDGDSIGELLEGFAPKSDNIVLVIQALRNITETLVTYANTTSVVNTLAVLDATKHLKKDKP